MRISACRKVFLSFLILAVGWTCAEAAEVVVRGSGVQADLRGLPVLSSFQLYQIGDTELVLTILGKRLPPPEIINSGSDTLVILREARWEGQLQETHSNTVPMISGLTTTQSGRDVVISLRTEIPLQLKSTRGTAPADTYTLRLTTMEQYQKQVEEPVATQQPQTLRGPTGPFAVNTPITLDLRDAELRDVFRMLGAHLKKNIIIDPSLPPALVTMTLKNVPLSEAFNYLMKTYDIGYEIMGNTIVVGTVPGLSRVAGNEETRMFRIAYADPAAMATLLGNLTGITADRLVVDPRLRTIYATSYPAKLEEIAIALQRLDNPGQQIMLHARILEFTNSATLDVETALNGVYDHWWFNYSGQNGIREGYVDDNRRGRNYAPTETTGLITPTTTDLLTPMQGVWREFDAAFRAMESKGKGKTLANPSVITIDGMEASISLTEDYPYISDRDDGGNPTWSTETVGPQLKMTPRLGRDGVVSIQLNIETGQVIEMITGSTGESMPRTSTRSVTTQVRVRDGEPFVIGGLFSDTQTNRRVRVPVLGQIPLLGEIFTYRYNEHQKSQVVIVVVPYILNTPDVAIDQERVMYRQ
jgi:type IV pilus assembly protein PilQ